LIGRAEVRRRRVCVSLVSLVAAMTLLAASPAYAFDPLVEALNFSKITERQIHLTSKPEFQARMAEQNAQDTVEYPQIVLADPERDFTQHICSHRTFECAGDVRFYDWDRDGHGVVRPVLFTARNGATISGNVWAGDTGPAKRPAVVITTGGLAPETLYWGFAATLARHGYVVLTYEVQGQGRSDTYGEEPDRMEGRTGGAQAFASGQPFYDGTEDALDFVLSTEQRPYEPRPSCGNANGGVGTDHSPKQDRRVAEGLNAAHNPLWSLVDPERVGVAGHSQGAGGVSFVGQKDPRVDSIVAWDRLAIPENPPAECPSAPESRADAEITKPALGFTGDYHQPPEPNTSDPDPEARNGPFSAYAAAGVDSMQINIRGGTHYEFSFMAGYTTTYPFGTATLRGYDLVAWYTTAWLDRYVKCLGRECKHDAEQRLLSDRWREDPREGAVDPTGDPNLFSFYLRSRFALHGANGARLSCDDMRSGCPSMRPDSRPPDYDLYQDAFSSHSGVDPGAPPSHGADPGVQPGPGTRPDPGAQPGSPAKARKGKPKRCARAKLKAGKRSGPKKRKRARCKPRSKRKQKRRKQ
jgi:dienelactone hydrolase